MGRKPTAVTVTRRYRKDEISCAEAIRRLLEYGKLDHAQKEAAPKSRPDAAKGFEHASRHHKYTT